MSVLLEALKKAAAEKKKAMDNTVDSEIVLADSKKVEETTASPMLKLFTEELVSSTSKDESLSPRDSIEDELEPALKFTLSEKPALVDLGSDTSETSTLLESPDVASDNIQNAPEESGQLSVQDQPKVVNSSVANDEPSVPKAEPSFDSEDSDLLETDKDSFEWSMNALPGYSTASVDDSVPIEKNSILLKGALTSEPKEKKKNNSSNSSWLLILIVVLIFVAISVYGLVYYQKKSEQLESSMRQYELAKIQVSLPKKQLPATTAVDNPLQQTEDSTSVKASDANDAARVPSRDIKSDNIAIPVVPSELATSVINVHNKATPEPKVIHSAIKKEALSSTTKPINQPVLVKVNTTQILLLEAYRAYELGHLESSQQKFNEVLTLEPSNVTAMIGLGGVAAATGQYYIAMDYYQQALIIEPNKLEVYEAIANLSPNIELNSEWNDSLKNMVTIYPDSAMLQFALGNLYASSNDWLAAQESYFNAYALDMNNPDFAVNLAISLDQLGKYPLAGQYYTQALALAGSNKVNFNVSDIKSRLVSLRQFMDQE